jgi:hypothetical protein
MAAVLGLPLAEVGLVACSPSAPVNTDVPVTIVTTVAVGSAKPPLLQAVDPPDKELTSTDKPLQPCPKDNYRKWKCGTHRSSEGSLGRSPEGCVKDSRGLRRRAYFPTRQAYNATMPVDSQLTQHYRTTAKKSNSRRAASRAEHCCYSACQPARVAAAILPKSPPKSGRLSTITRCYPAFDSVSASAPGRSDCPAFVKGDRDRTWMRYDSATSKRLKGQPESFGGVAGVDVCCYRGKARIRIMRGRPVRVAGEPRLSPWQPGKAWLWPVSVVGPAEARASEATTGSATLDTLLAERWAADAAMEHASVAAFGRLANELLCLGAAPELVAGCHAAARDEIRHAQLAARVAASFGAEPLAAGALKLPSFAATRSCDSVLWETFLDGCIGELVAAACAQRSAELCQQPKLAEVHRGIFNDELGHAELAWRIVAWGVQRSGSFRRRLEDWLNQAPEPASKRPTQPDSLAEQACEWGLLPHWLERQLHTDMTDGVVRPVLRDLLSASAAPADAAAMPVDSVARTRTPLGVS